jgi:hypothetical protein
MSFPPGRTMMRAVEVQSNVSVIVRVAKESIVTEKAS